MSALIPIGAIVGSFSVFAILLNVGRRSSLIFTDILSIIGMLFCIYSVYTDDLDNAWLMLMIGRGICGICTGLNSTLIPNELYDGECNFNKLLETRFYLYLLKGFNLIFFFFLFGVLVLLLFNLLYGLLLLLIL